MKKNILFLLLLLLLAIDSCLWAGKILYPWRSTPTIVKAGENFEVWYEASSGETINSVELQGEYNKVETSINVKSGSWKWDLYTSKKYDTKIDVEVPAGTPADRYDLVISGSKGKQTATAAVRVIKEYKKSYYLLHFSDTHSYWSEFKGDPFRNLQLEKVSALVDIANILNPEVIMNTGDNVSHKPKLTEERINGYFNGDQSKGEFNKGLNDFKGPVFTLPGNHDHPVDKKDNPTPKSRSEFWYEWWGKHYHNFAYGNSRFMGVNNGWTGDDRLVEKFEIDPQLDAIEDWLDDVGKGKFRMGAAHKRGKPIAKLDERVDVSIQLAGHNHNEAKSNPDNIYAWDPGEDAKNVQFVANAIRNHFEFNLFEVNDNTGSFKGLSGAHARVQCIQNEREADPKKWKPIITLDYDEDNDGSSLSNTATIVSKLNFDVEDARIRFVMPKGATYDISEGTIAQQFEGTDYHIVDVDVDVKKNSSKSVSITGVGFEETLKFANPEVFEEVIAGVPFTVKVEAEGNGGVEWVRLVIDDVFQDRNYDAGSDGLYHFDVTLSEGDHDIRIRMKDGAGNVISSNETITVTAIKAVEEVLVFDNIADGAEVVAGESFDVAVDAVGDGGVEWVRLVIDDVFQERNYDVGEDGLYHFDVSLVEGAHELRLKMQNGEGVKIDSEATITLTAVAPPEEEGSVEFVDLVDDSTFDADLIRVRAEAPSGIDSVALIMDGEEIGRDYTTNTKGFYTFRTEGLEGKHRFRARARDNEGNNLRTEFVLVTIQ